MTAAVLFSFPGWKDNCRGIRTLAAMLAVEVYLQKAIVYNYNLDRKNNLVF